jgi:NTP-dependent ternary conflict system VMAP-like protein/trypsin-like peptidase/effector-associated domain 2 (EAD2)-containing protein
VHSADGRSFGPGVLVLPDLVLTCASVISRGDCPKSPVVVDFFAPNHAVAHPGTVIPDSWIPPDDDTVSDLALIRLDEPAPVTPAVLSPCGAGRRRTVHAYGYPAGRQRHGDWATALTTAIAAPRNEWVHLADPNPVGELIEPGFSGAGVCEAEGRFVFGLVIGSDRTAQPRGAWMIGLEALVRRLPRLRPHLMVAPRTPGQPPIGVSDPARRLYEEAIVEQLALLDGAGDRETRDELVREAQIDLGTVLQFARSDRVRADFLELVRACLDHPSGNQLSSLVAAVRRLHGNQDVLLRLNELLAQDPGRSLSGDDIAAIGGLIDALRPAAGVNDAAYEAFGPLGPTGAAQEVDIHDREQLVRALVQIIGGPGSPPLLEFLHRLAVLPQVTPAQADALRFWIDQVAESWDVAATAWPVSRPVHAAPRTLRSWLIIILQEDGPNPDRYLLSIWLHHETDGDPIGRSLMTDDEQPRTMDELPGSLGPHLRQVVNQQAAPLTIEFVVPFRLLFQDFDRISIALRGISGPLGASHPVVLRSQDRIENGAVHHRWRARWQWLQEHQHHVDTSSALRFIDLPTVARPGAVDDELRRLPDMTITHQVPVGLVLSTGARARAQTVLTNAIREALDLGLPVLLWCRDQRLTQRFLTEMHNRLQGRPLADIPSVVQRMRSQAAIPESPADDIGGHLSLLWDDASRLPPGNEFRAPAREEWP